MEVESIHTYIYTYTPAPDSGAGPRIGPSGSRYLLSTGAGATADAYIPPHSLTHSSSSAARTWRSSLLPPLAMRLTIMPGDSRCLDTPYTYNYIPSLSTSLEHGALHLDMFMYDVRYTHIK